MSKLFKSTNNVNRESDEIPYITHDPGYILQSSPAARKNASCINTSKQTSITSARRNVSCINTFKQTMSNQKKCSSVSQIISKESKLRSTRLAKQSKPSLPVYENLPKYSKDQSPVQYKDKPDLQNIGTQSINQCRLESSNASPSLFMGNVIRSRSDVYDIAESGQNRKSKDGNFFYQKHGKIISIVTCSVIFSTVVLVAILYGTDILACKMKAIEMANPTDGSPTIKETPRYTIDSHPPRHRFLFKTEVVLKSTQKGHSKWLVIEFCKNQTLEKITIKGNKGNSDNTGPEIVALVSSDKINENRNNDTKKPHATKLSCKNPVLDDSKFTLECNAISGGQFLTLYVK